MKHAHKLMHHISCLILPLTPNAEERHRYNLVILKQCLVQQQNTQLVGKQKETESTTTMNHIIYIYFT